jgi:tartrate dehydrogenase/decarboxylase/D-malate dehydrogenase
VTAHRIAVIAGDGIGQEVVPAAISCIDALAPIHGIQLEWVPFEWGSDYFRAHGRMMPVDALDTLESFESIFLGAVGAPDISDVETLWGLLIPIRRRFEQYINLRPVRTLPGVRGQLRDDRPIDMMIVRENNEGEYSEVGGRVYRGLPEESAIQETVFTRHGVSRAARFAAALASGRRGAVTSATKSNGIVHTMPFWDDVVREVVAKEYPNVALRSELIDALAASLVIRPWSFDVIVASNLFGDILSDLGGALTGSIGVSPSANLNPERAHPSMFEPVHGSAPDIAGQGIANPIGQIWSGAMMLDHLGHPRAAAHLVAAFEKSLTDGVRTRDLGGDSSTSEVSKSVVANLEVTAAAFTD